MSVHLGSGLALPTDVVTQTVAILARKGSGKSFTARRLAEQLFKAGQQIVVLDPKGDWWGIRSAADGRGPGLEVVIIGGEHGDVPLEVGAGEVVGRLVAEERVSVVLDLSALRKHEVATFCTSFLETLYRLKAKEANRTPVMLLVDEADAIAPQRPQRGEERMLGAIEDIVRRGRQRGIGCTLVSQRSAVLNKNVLTQAQVMVALRTIAPQDLAALDAWIEVHGTPEQRAQMMESLPALPRGDAWVWSPGWPNEEGIFKRRHIDLIETFDSGATPEPGKAAVVPKKRADVDLDALRRQMAETVERAQSNDPARLKKRVAELEAALAKSAAAPAPGRVVEKAVLRPADLSRLERALERLAVQEKHFADSLAHATDALSQRQQVVVSEAGALRVALERFTAPAPPPPAARWVPPRPARRPGADLVLDKPRGNGADHDSRLGKGERAVLTAVAQYAPGGVSREQLTVLTGYKRSSRDSFLQRLRATGMIDDGPTITVTQAGLLALGPGFEPLPTGAALLSYWRERLPEGERRVLDVAVAAFPDAARKEAIDEQTGYKRSSRDSFIQRLRARRLLTDTGGGVRAAAELF